MTCGSASNTKKARRAVTATAPLLRSQGGRKGVPLIGLMREVRGAVKGPIGAFNATFAAGATVVRVKGLLPISFSSGGPSS